MTQGGQTEEHNRRINEVDLVRRLLDSMADAMSPQGGHAAAMYVHARTLAAYLAHVIVCHECFSVLFGESHG